MKFKISRLQAGIIKMIIIDLVVVFLFINSEFHELNNAIDLGMKSNRGLKPPKISAKESRFPERGQKSFIYYHHYHLFISNSCCPFCCILSHHCHVAFNSRFQHCLVLPVRSLHSEEHDSL